MSFYLEHFYFKKGANDAYSSSGTFTAITNYVGRSHISDTKVFPPCKFFKDFNSSQTSKIIEHVSAPSTITKYDPNFVTIPLWDNKTFFQGVNSRPARKVDMDVIRDLYLTTNTSQYREEYDTFAPAQGAGIIILSGGGGAGGGGDSGGWLDEPAGGAGGGSGGWVVLYYRYKVTGPLAASNCLTIKFGTSSDPNSGNYWAQGQGREKPGQGGAYAYAYYKGTKIAQCNGGGGGGSDNTSNTTYGGGGGGRSTAVHSGSGTNVLVDDTHLYVYCLKSGDGVAGQNSGQGGASGNAGCVGTQTIAIPSSAGSATITWGNKGGGAGGKKHNSDPGGGGGAGGIYGEGGRGSTGDGNAWDGDPTAGGGGASERHSYAGQGGCAVAIHYKYI